MVERICDRSRIAGFLSRQNPGGGIKPPFGSAAPAEQSRGQKQNGSQQSEHGVEGHTHDPQGQGDQPNDWKQNERQKRQRPIENQQDAPAHEQDQRFHWCLYCGISRSNVNCAVFSADACAARHQRPETGKLQLPKPATRPLRACPPKAALTR